MDEVRFLFNSTKDSFTKRTRYEIMYETKLKNPFGSVLISEMDRPVNPKDLILS